MKRPIIYEKEVRDGPFKTFNCLLKVSSVKFSKEIDEKPFSFLSLAINFFGANVPTFFFWVAME